MADLRTPTEREEDVDARERVVSALLVLGDRMRLRGGAAAVQAGGGERMSEGDAEALLQTIEVELIPRLLLAHSAPESRRRAVVTAEDRARIMEAVIEGSPAACHRVVEAMSERGVPRDVIFLDLLAYAARRLGELWEADRCDFTTVTIGLCRLHELLREHGLDREAIASTTAEDAPRILLASQPGDQHVFGVVMVSEFFRRAGWRVCIEPGASLDRLSTLVGEETFDLIGLSAACSVLAEDLRDEIAVLRGASRNRQLRVLVGGGLFMNRPDLVREVGADAAAFDAQSAPDAGKSLLARPFVRG